MSGHRQQEPAWTSVRGAGVRAGSPAKRGRSALTPVSTRARCSSDDARGTTTSCGRRNSNIRRILELANTRRRGPRASTPRRGYARPRRAPCRRSDLRHCRPPPSLCRGTFVRARLREARRAGRPKEGVDVGCGAPGGLCVYAVWRRRAGRRYRSPLSTPQAQVRVRGDGTAVALDERAADRQNHRPASIYGGTCLMGDRAPGGITLGDSSEMGRPASEPPPRPGAVGGSGRRCG